MDEYLQHLPLLSTEVCALLNSEFSDDEFLTAVKKVPTKLSPDPDGLSPEFYKMFSEQYSKIMKWLIDESLRIGSLP